MLQDREDTMSPEDARNEYRTILRRSAAKSPQEFNTLVAELLASKGIKEATPEQWVKAAKRVHIPCYRCACTGAFITGSINGIPTGPGGSCFRCNGKGYQTDEDAERNYWYDRAAIVRAFHLMTKASAHG
jgi:hypothetical protein